MSLIDVLYPPQIRIPAHTRTVILTEETPLERKRRLKRERQRRYRARHPEYRQTQAWREKRREQQRRRRAKPGGLERQRETDRKWRARNPEYAEIKRQRERERYAADPELRRKWWREWYAANREQYLERRKQMRAGK